MHGQGGYGGGGGRAKKRLYYFSYFRDNLYLYTHYLLCLKAEGYPLIRFASKDGWLTATSRIAFGRSMDSGYTSRLPFFVISSAYTRPKIRKDSLIHAI